MVQKVINTAYQCGIEVTEKRNLKPEEYSQILKDIRERDERKRIEAEKKAQEEAELRRKMAKERKATAGRWIIKIIYFRLRWEESRRNKNHPLQSRKFLV